MIRKIVLISLFLLGTVNAASITTDKNTYTLNESIVTTFTEMSGNEEDWIAIYPAGSDNVWANVIQWDWVGAVNGSHTFSALPAGDYEVRAFFNNSYNLEASKSFTVEEGVAVELSTSSDVYTPTEAPLALFENMPGNDNDWIGIYPAGSSNAWANMIQWDWLDSANGSHLFEALPIGDYEVRVFFNNSLNSEASKAFSVENIPVTSTVYEDAENGINANWIHVSGNYAPIHYGQGGFESSGALVLVPEWNNSNANGWTNNAEYRLALNADASKKVLEIDIGGLGNYTLPNGSKAGYIAHFNVSVRIETTDGSRRIIWDSFYNHNGITEPFSSAGGSVINSPSPVEHVRGWYEPDVFKWEHFKVNIETVLRQIEPNNSVISIDSFSATGGYLDNIKLSSH